MTDPCYDFYMKKRWWYAGIGGVFFLLFFILSFLVSRDVFDQIDFDTTVRLQDNIPRSMDEPFSFLSTIGSFEVTSVAFFIFLAINAYLAKKWYRALLFSFFILFHVVEVLGKSAIEHYGPPFMFHRNTNEFHFPSGYISTDYFSYPSGHVGRMLFFVGIFWVLVYVQKWNWRKKIVTWGVLAGISLVMIVSRIYLGEHWLSDTIGGMLLGLSFAFLTMIFW